MKTSYRELDYAYGESMQKLRNAIGLTQAALADRVGVSWRTVAGWEAGSCYPRAEHLKALIALAVQQQAFSVGHEAEEIRVLWKVAHQKMWLDEQWLSALLDQRHSPHGATVETGQAQGTVPTAPVPKPPPLTPVEEAIRSTSVKSGSLHNDENDKDANEAEAPKPSKPESLDENDHAQESHHSFVQTSSQTSADQPQRSPILGGGSAQGKVPVSGTIPTTRKKRNLLIYILIALIILAIIGSAGTFFFQARLGATGQANKTVTTKAYPGYLTGKGTFAFFDPLSQEGKWQPAINTLGGRCQFIGGAYHVSEPPTGYFGSCPSNGTFSNFAFEVQLTIMQGDCGGMTFRDGDQNGYYYFQICRDGTYKLCKYFSNYSSDGAIIIRSGQNSIINTGLGQQNKIAVVASSSTMTYYVNEQQIDQEQDSSYTWGHISLIANSPYGNTTDVAYSNARLWTL